MVAIGDIVEVRQLPGELWAVMGLVDNPIPPSRVWRLQSTQQVNHSCPSGRYLSTAISP